MTAAKKEKWREDGSNRTKKPHLTSFSDCMKVGTEKSRVVTNVGDWVEAGVLKTSKMEMKDKAGYSDLEMG
jgi:hypothetical protein